MCNEFTEDFPITTFADFHASVSGNAYKRYAYRGHESKEFLLIPGLYRVLQQLGVQQRYWLPRERGIIDSFRKKAHQYLNHRPTDGASLEWLSIMQHFGAPTRLLDFTYSPYIALFFAIETLNQEPAVYEINLSTLKKLNNQAGVKYSDHVKQSLLDSVPNSSVVVPFEPEIDFDYRDMKRAVKLLKAMSIDNMRLFPGVEGLARSMSLSLLEPVSYL